MKWDSKRDAQLSIERGTSCQQHIQEAYVFLYICKLHNTVYRLDLNGMQTVLFEMCGSKSRKASNQLKNERN